MHYELRQYATIVVASQQLKTWAIAQACKAISVDVFVFGAMTLVGLLMVLALLALLSGLLYLLQQCIYFLM